MSFRKILKKFNVAGQCQSYGLSLWQCPQFLFLIMGLIIIASTLSAYAIGTKYLGDPFLAALVTIAVTFALFVIAFVIVQSFDKLAEVSRTKSEFISIISHQLRSPLSNLKWAVEILMSGRLGQLADKQTEYFKILKENSSRMHELINDLLTVSRIETAKIPFKKEEFSLREMIESLVSEFRSFAESSNVQIKVLMDDAENPFRIFNDPRQLRQVIENLLDNAVRYIKDKGEVILEIKNYKNRLCLKIIDNGVGIPKADRKYIFQKFFRSESALRHQTEGSGLGLYIAKAIIERLGGKIKFSSQEGRGSTFWITIPMKS